MERPDETGGGATAPTRGREVTRERILTSAKELFTNEGFGSVSSRMIASHAGVNVALINRYFGSKAGLLTEILREDGVFPRLITDGPPEELTRRLAEHAVSRLYGEGSALQRALDHSAGDPDLQSVYQGRLKSALLDPLTVYLGRENARLHASLVAAVLLGLSRVRRVEGGDALRTSDRAQLTERVLALLELCLEDFGAPDPDDP
ncbi:TetR/AcrR family transcriptional regulator [Nocardiopsis sp. MG754419]|uniref:TetR/AcrR family transcriptional regulator n=1 Tax=Nocardiopsis sp. MG754419 TaxID=2259865 RepID=UPI001BAAF405|nr:TetR/AcrR family transcriptional regulator [Nocardiopsis sp. MG754419]MBR8741677.1 TetR/AcrR family transcriptional regulator [Nocardiopsis sp. MG754419]